MMGGRLQEQAKRHRQQDNQPAEHETVVKAENFGAFQKTGGGGIAGQRLIFDSPTKLHALAIRDDEMFLVEIEITE